jgi:hypothetical protein
LFLLLWDESDGESILDSHSCVGVAEESSAHQLTIKSALAAR